MSEKEIYASLLKPIKDLYESIELLIGNWGKKYPTNNLEEAKELDKDIKGIINLFIPLLPDHIKPSGVEYPECNINGINEGFRHHTNIEIIREENHGDFTYSLLFCHVCCLSFSFLNRKMWNSPFTPLLECLLHLPAT